MPVQRSPPRARSASPIPSPVRRPLYEEPTTRSSRRTQSLPPEYGLLPPRTRQPTRSPMDNQSSQNPSAAAVVYLPVAPRTPTPFHGEVHEDVEDWLQHYERVARHFAWTPEQCLQNVYFALEGTARTWFENHEASISSWQDFQAELRRTFASQQRRQRAEELLQASGQGPNESVTSFVEDVLRLMNRADPNAPEEKLRFLMRGVKENIFGGLVRSPPTTVEDFVTEATNIERALQARDSHYQRLPGVSAVPQSACDLAHGIPGIGELIREVVREEQLLPTAERPASISIAEVVRDEVQRAFLPEAPVTVAAADEPTLTYAAVARRPPPTARHYPVAPRRDPPTQTYPRRNDEGRQYDRRERSAPRKTDVWRTADRRPICYHCGEADHIYRRCPYRQIGLRGFHPNDPRPRSGERPRAIEEYLRRLQSPPAIRRVSRSPSLRRPASPMHRRRRESLSGAPRSSPGKLGAATPGGGVAEDDRRQDPPRTSDGPHSNTTRDRSDAPATKLHVVIDGHDASALVDTGADYSVLSGRLSQRLRKVTTPWDGPQIWNADGHLITPVGICTARVEIHGETRPVKFVVLQDCSRDVILGMDFLCEYGAVIDLRENRLTLRKPAPAVKEPKATSSTVRVLADHVNLPPRSSVFVPIGIDEAFCGDVLLEGSLQLLLGRGIGSASQGASRSSKTDTLLHS
ncbi:uncharacterized protein ISCGN_032228 [Ixodes scapularis]